MKASRILVTGGAGAIGGTLVELLSRDPRRRILVLDDLSSGRLERLPGRPNVELFRGSVCSEADLRRAFHPAPETVFHLAAHFANQRSVDFPEQDLETNGMGTLRVLRHAARAGVARFVFASSSSAIGSGADTPYAVTKRLGEEYVAYFGRHRGLKAVILRYYNVYGPGELPGPYRNVVANFMARALRGEDLVITGTGAETRDFNFVEDVARATLLASLREEAVSRTIPVGSGRETRIDDLAAMILGVAGSRSRIVFGARRAWDSVRRRAAPVGPAKRLLGYKPQVGLSNGLRLYRDWLAPRLDSLPQPWVERRS